MSNDEENNNNNKDDDDQDYSASISHAKNKISERYAQINRLP